MTLGDVWLDFDPAALVLTGLDVDDDLAFLALLALQRRGPERVISFPLPLANTETWYISPHLFPFRKVALVPLLVGCTSTLIRSFHMATTSDARLLGRSLRPTEASSSSARASRSAFDKEERTIKRFSRAVRYGTR